VILVAQYSTQISFPVILAVEDCTISQLLHLCIARIFNIVFDPRRYSSLPHT
jgi:hypothetical protein